jgi:hypothetical protein
MTRMAILLLLLFLRNTLFTWRHNFFGNLYSRNSKQMILGIRLIAEVDGGSQNIRGLAIKTALQMIQLLKSLKLLMKKAWRLHLLLENDIDGVNSYDD